MVFSIFRYKKGQIDKIIVGFPVFLILFLLMAGFIFLSYGMKLIKEPYKPNIDSQFLKDNFLLDEFKIDGKTYLVFEGLSLIGNNIIPGRQSDMERNFYSKFTPELIRLAGNNCILLSTPKSFLFILRDKVDNGIRERRLVDYRESGKLSKLSLRYGEKIEIIEYYYGECLK